MLKYVVAPVSWWQSRGNYSPTWRHSIDGSLCFTHIETAAVQEGETGYTEYTIDELNVLLETPEWKPEEELI